jgi:hypothetical protein
MQELRANTEVKVPIGPVVAVANGYVPVTTLALNTADEAEILKHDAAGVTDISAATFAAIANADGYYNLTITAALADTEGMLTVLINDDDLCLPVKEKFMVLSEAAWDSKYVAKDDGFMDVNLKTIKDQTITCGAAVTVNPSVGAATIVPTVTEFEARTLPAADYVVVGDTIAAVTTVGTVTGAITDKTGFALSATGADLILKTSTFAVAIAAAINELATYGLTALNTLLVTTGIKAATVSDKTGYALSAIGNTAVIDEFETQSNADPTGFKVNVMEIESADATDQIRDSILSDATRFKGVDISRILTDTGTTLDDKINIIQADTTTDIPALINALNDITVADIIAGIADGTYDLQEMMRIMFAVLAGKSSGGASNTIKFRDSADTKNRVSAITTNDGNRTTVTLDGS